MLTATVAAAQTDPAVGDPRPSERPARRAPADAKPPGMSSRRFDELTPRQKQRAQQAMARDGEPALDPTDARQRWDATPERERRQATRRVGHAPGGDAGAARDRPPRQPPMEPR